MRIFGKSILSVCLCLAAAGIGTTDESRIDLSTLSGNWDGQGTYILPFTGISTSVDAIGILKYDSTTNVLHTRFTAERFMIKYSDSGRMSYQKNSDSLKWDVWNSFGYFIRYKGKADGKKIHGRQKMGKYTYDLYLELVTNDSIDIKITATEKDGESSDRLTGYLRRTKLDN